MNVTSVSMKDYTSLCIGGEAMMATITSEDDLLEALVYAKEQGLEVCCIGEGTNMFFGNTLEKYLMLKMSLMGKSIEAVSPEGEYILKAYAGESWDAVVAYAVEKGLWGIENLSYIPGTVGAAPVQNIGAYGAELRDTLVSVEAINTMTLERVVLSQVECEFGYRDSLFKRQKGKHCITSITLKLSTTRNPKLTYKPLDTTLSYETCTLEEVRNAVIAVRKSKLPDYKKYPNAGSFFKNPTVSFEKGVLLRVKYPDISLIETGDSYKIPAAWLIEHVAHMKGVQMGNVGTWPSQPLVIVNYGESTVDEILAFSGSIIETIKEATGVLLEREVNFVS